MVDSFDSGVDIRRCDLLGGFYAKHPAVHASRAVEEGHLAEIPISGLKNESRTQ